MPKVSVLIPIYNSGGYIREAIQSILNQSFSDFEVIIVNDGSTDNSISEIKKFHDKRIKLYNYKKNRGLTLARNSSLDFANGEYVAWLDADDMSHPKRLETQINFLDSHRDVAVCGTWVHVFGGSTSSTWKFPVDHSDIFSGFLFNNRMAMSSVVHRNFSYIPYHFNETYTPAIDYEIWSRIGKKMKLHNLPQILTFYRLHDKQISNKEKPSELGSAWTVQANFLKKLGIDFSEQEKSIHLKLGLEFTEDRIREINAFDVDNWMERIFRANMERVVFEENSLRKTLGEKWFNVCQAQLRSRPKPSIKSSFFMQGLHYKKRNIHRLFILAQNIKIILRNQI